MWVFFFFFSGSLLILSVWSYRWYFAVISMSGVFAVTFSVIFAYVADITQEHERSTAYGLVSRGTWLITSFWCCAVTTSQQLYVDERLHFVARRRILVSCYFDSRLWFPFWPCNEIKVLIVLKNISLVVNAADSIFSHRYRPLLQPAWWQAQRSVRTCQRRMEIHWWWSSPRPLPCSTSVLSW